MAVGHRKGEARLHEQEVVGDERKERGRDRGPGAEQHRRGQDRAQKHHGQVRERGDEAQLFRDQSGDRDEPDRGCERTGHGAADVGEAPAPFGRGLALGRDDVDADPFGTADQFERQRAAYQFAQRPGAGATDDDVRGVLAPGEAEDGLRQIVADRALDVGAEVAGERQRLFDPSAVGFVRQVVRALDEERDPRRIHLIRHALRRANHRPRQLVRTDEGEDALAGGPRPLDARRAHPLGQVVVDRLRGPAERQFPQRRQVLRLEEGFDRALGGILDVDLAVGEPLQELVGRQIDDHDLVGVLEHRVRNGFAHAHAGDLQDDVVEAFEMLHVERGPDLDAGRDQLLDVLPALRMARARHVRMREFVDQQHLRARGQRAVDVEFRHHPVAMHQEPRRKALDPVEHGLGLAPSVGFDHADEDAAAGGCRLAGGGQHRVGLADAGRGAEKDLEPGAAFAVRDREQGVGIGAVRVAGHGASIAELRRARCPRPCRERPRCPGRPSRTRRSAPRRAGS